MKAYIITKNNVQENITIKPGNTYEFKGIKVKTNTDIRKYRRMGIAWFKTVTNNNGYEFQISPYTLTNNNKYLLCHKDTKLLEIEINEKDIVVQDEEMVVASVIKVTRVIQPEEYQKLTNNTVNQRGLPNNTVDHVYEFDDDNNLSKKIWINITTWGIYNKECKGLDGMRHPNDEVRHEIHVYEYQYNEDGKIIEEIYYRDDETMKGEDIWKKEQWQYDEQGFEVMNIRKRKSRGSEVTTRLYVHDIEYDNLKRRVRSINSNGSVYKWEYDSQGRGTRKITESEYVYEGNKTTTSSFFQGKEEDKKMIYSWERNDKGCYVNECEIEYDDRIKEYVKVWEQNNVYYKSGQLKEIRVYEEDEDNERITIKQGELSNNGIKACDSQAFKP